MEDSIITQEAEQEIDLKLLVLHVLHRWRSLLAVMLAAAVILAGASAVKNTLVRSDPESIGDVLADYSSQKDSYDYALNYYESSLEELTRKLDTLNSYQENSILANLDASSMWIGSLDLYVSEKDGLTDSNSLHLANDPADALASAYAVEISNGRWLASLADEMGIDLNYLKELVSVSANYVTNSVSIRVLSQDEATAARILDAFETHAGNLQSEIQQQFGNHTVVISGRDISNDVNACLALTKDWDALIPDTKELQQQSTKQIADVRKALKDLEEPKAPAILNGFTMTRDAVKCAVVGGVLGFFLLAVCYAAGYVLDQRIHSGEDLKSRFGVRVLGAFPHPFQAKHVTRFDAWLNRLEGNGPADPRKLHDHIAAGIHVLAGDHRKILLTGAVDAPRIAHLRDELAPALPGLELSAGGCVNAEPAVLRSLTGYDGIVLVEGVGETRYTDVAAELSYIRALGLPVLGVVVL